MRVGRRWRYSHDCKKIKKTNPEDYPDIQRFVKEAVEAYQSFDKAKSLAHNRPKEVHAVLPENKWHLSYGFVNNKPTVALTAGLSA